MPLVTLPKTTCLPSNHSVLTVHRKNCSTQEHVADKSHPQLPKEDTHAYVVCVCGVSQRCIAAYSTMMQMTYTSQIECSQLSKQENALSH